MELLSQVDPRWRKVRIGYSNATLGRYGCLITDLCMLLEKLRGYAASPPDAARHWAFNRRGEILWKKCKFAGMKFVKRGYYSDFKKVGEYANDPDKGAVLEINHGKHWVLLEKADGKKLQIMDPIDGTRHTSLPMKYKFTGYALFEKAPMQIPEWLKPFWKIAKEKGLESNDPAMKLEISTLLDALLEMGLIDKPKEELTMGEFVTALQKIKERW